MTWFSEEMLISNICIHGFMCSAIKKSWKVSTTYLCPIHYVLSIYVLCPIFLDIPKYLPKNRTSFMNVPHSMCIDGKIVRVKTRDRFWASLAKLSWENAFYNKSEANQSKEDPDWPEDRTARTASLRQQQRRAETIVIVGFYTRPIFRYSLLCCCLAASAVWCAAPAQSAVWLHPFLLPFAAAVGLW